MKSLVIKELKIMLKDKGNIFWLIVMPILFIVLFASLLGNVGESSITVNYVDQDQSITSEQFIEQIGQIDGFELEASSEPVDDQIQQIKDGDMASLILIPEGFEAALRESNAPVQIEFYRDTSSGELTSPIQAVLNNIASGYREQKLAANLTAFGISDQEANDLLQPPIEVKEIAESAPDANIIEHIVPGYMVMFVFFIWITMVNRFHEDRDSGMVARLRSTPMNTTAYLVGMWIPAAISVLIQCTVLLAFGYFVYGLQLGHIGTVSLIVLCLTFCGTGLGLAVSIIVKSFNMGLAITQVFALGGAMLGGLWFPIDMMPEFVQAIGKFTPQYWAQSGLQDVMVGGAHIADVWPTFVILLSLGAAGLVIALMRYKYFLRSATN